VAIQGTVSLAPLGSLVADELFIAYEVQQAHRILFDLELITLLTLRLLPDE
jgi:hypothetical protein